VDCVGANRIPLALTPGFFEAERACAGGVCGLDDCCAPPHCHDAPGWATSGEHDCDDVVRDGYCARTDYCSADEICPAAACCGCGGGSAELLPSCANPTGASWDGWAIDCAAAGRIPSTPPAGPGECAGAACGLEDCCRPADWAPVCTGAHLKALVAGSYIDPACKACIDAHGAFDLFCYPLGPSRTACSAADTALDVHDKENFFAAVSGTCLACFLTLDPDHNDPDSPGFWGPCTEAAAPSSGPAPPPSPPAPSEPRWSGDQGPFTCAGGPCPSPTVDCGYLSAACDSLIGKYHVTLTDARDGSEVRTATHCGRGLLVCRYYSEKKGDVACLCDNLILERPAWPGERDYDDTGHLQRLVRGQVLHRN
jgi:hypothetical protein